MKNRDYIWDLGGTLLDNYQMSTQAFVESLRHFGVDATPEHVYEKLKLSTDQAIAYFIPTEPAFLAYYKQIEAEKLEHPLLFPDAKLALETVVANGGRNFLISHRDNHVKDLLQKTGIIHLFTEVVTADNGFARKPNPQSMLYLKESYKLTQVLVVGDREIDVQAGQAAGFDTCLVTGKKSLMEIVTND
ncbi:HAD-IA family hydrolase [Streptococcus saliviloxodontae]|uniref:Phosphoglycolate phosphatase-like HAD superfamily hydrolase n=1 Tax=Streptococcus saliviloxodontae TaxID=1349416 RepID=A0ABS2PLE3_9STRE|nr:HAD-IA family hydrolase [Streptococcus saliviloxodontae]MBM7636263.1 phosphoglycolate phosphatase-like HAD superfamily hydrolase [Streptococcus saliviloxodontae]